jgi:PKD repeat protein
VSVTGAAPTATASAPASGPEGTAVSLTGTATSPSAEDNTIGFTYGWSVTKNGITYPTVSGTGSRWHFTPNDNGVYVVTMKATDDGNMSDTSSATINVFNVAPTATITTAGGTTLLVRAPEQSLDFNGTWSDPGTADTHTYQWLFGDGTSSTALNTTHSYSAAGTYHVTLNVRDDDGGLGTDTATVLVQSPQQALTTIETTVNGISTLNKGQKNSLIAKLEAASAAAARGNNTASHNEMSAFLNEVRAYVKTGNITASQQAALTDAIHAIEAALGTYNRILQWWPLEP